MARFEKLCLGNQKFFSYSFFVVCPWIIFCYQRSVHPGTTQTVGVHRLLFRATLHLTSNMCGQICIGKCKPNFVSFNFYNTIEILTCNILRIIFFLLSISFNWYMFSAFSLVCNFLHFMNVYFMFPFRLHYGLGFLVCFRLQSSVKHLFYVFYIEFVVTFRLIKTKAYFFISKCIIIKYKYN